MKNLNKRKENLKRQLLTVSMTAATLITPALATGGAIAESTIGKGLINLVKDTTFYLTILGPLTGTLMAVYFLIRRNVADEDTDKVMYKKRAISAGVGGIAVGLVNGIITLISGYFV